MKRYKNALKRQPNFKIARAAFLLVAVLLVCYLVTVVAGTQDFYNESAEKNATITIEEDLARANALVAEHYVRLYDIVDRIE